MLAFLKPKPQPSLPKALLKAVVRSVKIVLYFGAAFYIGEQVQAALAWFTSFSVPIP